MKGSVPSLGSRIGLRGDSKDDAAPKRLFLWHFEAGEGPNHAPILMAIADFRKIGKGLRIRLRFKRISGIMRHKEQFKDEKKEWWVLRQRHPVPSSGLRSAASWRSLVGRDETGADSFDSGYMDLIHGDISDSLSLDARPTKARPPVW
ncbi:hypothetical protein P691DRAFT_791920, partial [Macrolepiota fuliginosa MF-IS2]